MTRLKRWESPRREGRNHKGKGGSARQRQRRKQFQQLRQKLKQAQDHSFPGGSSPASFFWRSTIANSVRTKVWVCSAGHGLGRKGDKTSGF